jgi:putative aminopeptidase FrvX
MDKEKNLVLIKELSDARGISGFEDEVLDVIRRHGDGLGEWKEDSMRNLYLHRKDRKEGRQTVMLDAHTDEVGFIVKAIRPNGTLDFAALGGWVSSCVPAHRVLVRNDRGEWIPGIIASKPPHFLSEAEKKLAPEISDMVIDVGASSDREIREEYHIPIAAPVVPDVSFEYINVHDIMIGKAFDDRLGSAAVISTFRELANDELPINVTGAFAVQEEVGLRGAVVTAQTVTPDVAVVFEGCPADDNVAESHAVQAALKKGPMLRHIDSKMITNPRFQRFTLDTAREKGIPVQEAVRTGGATNAGAIHLSGMAVPVIVIAIPVRYIHTHYGIAAYSDFENSVRLACELMRLLDEKRIAGF